MNSCIIIGNANATTVQLLRCAKSLKKKILLLLISTQENAFSYAIKKCFSKNAVHSFASEREAVLFLKQKQTDFEPATVIFTSSDAAAEELDCHYDELSKRYVLSNIAGKQGELFQHCDKILMSKLAVESGFAIPQEYDDAASLPSSAFPCIIKPKHSALGGKSISVCRNDAEYEIAMNSYRGRGLPISVQQFIEKDYELCFTGCILPKTKQVLIPGVIRKIRESCGCTSFAKFEYNAEKYQCYHSVLDLMKKINYTGLFSVEVLCKGTQFYFLEVNFRADANLLSCAHAGCNLLSAFCEGDFSSKSSSVSPEDFLCMEERTDFWNVRLGKISFWHWFKDYLKTDCRYLMYSKDKRVFFFMLLFAIKRKFASLSKIFRK